MQWLLLRSVAFSRKTLLVLLLGVLLLHFPTHKAFAWGFKKRTSANQAAALKTGLDETSQPPFEPSVDSLEDFFKSWTAKFETNSDSCKIERTVQDNFGQQTQSLATISAGHYRHLIQYVDMWKASKVSLTPFRDGIQFTAQPFVPIGRSRKAKELLQEAYDAFVNTPKIVFSLELKCTDNSHGVKLQEAIKKILSDISNGEYYNFSVWIDANLNKLFLRYTAKASRKQKDQLIMEVGRLQGQQMTGKRSLSNEVEKTCVSSTYTLDSNEDALCRYLTDFRYRVKGYALDRIQSTLVQEISRLLSKDGCFPRFKFLPSNFPVYTSKVSIKRTRLGVYIVRFENAAKENEYEFSCNVIIGEPFRTDSEQEDDEMLLSLIPQKEYNFWIHEKNLQLLGELQQDAAGSQTVGFALEFDPIVEVDEGLQAWDQLLSKNQKPILSTLWTISNTMKQEDLYKQVPRGLEVRVVKDESQERSTDTVSKEAPGKKQAKRLLDTPHYIIPIIDILQRNGQIKFKVWKFMVLKKEHSKQISIKYKVTNLDALQHGVYMLSLDIAGIPGEVQSIEVLEKLSDIIWTVKWTLPIYKKSSCGLLSWFFWLDSTKSRLYLRYPTGSSLKTELKDHLIVDLDTIFKRWSGATEQSGADKAAAKWNHLQSLIPAFETNERTAATMGYALFILRSFHLDTKQLATLSKRPENKWTEPQVSALKTLLEKNKCKTSGKNFNLFNSLTRKKGVVAYIQTLQRSRFSFNKYRISFCSHALGHPRCTYCKIRRYWSAYLGEHYKDGIQRVYLTKHKAIAVNCSNEPQHTCVTLADK